MSSQWQRNERTEKSGWFLQWDCLEENQFFICKGLSIGDSFCVGEGTCVHFSFQLSDPSSLVYTCAGPGHAASISVSSYEHQSCWFRKSCFLGVLHPFWIVESWPMREWMQKSLSLHNVWLWVFFFFFSVSVGGNVSDDGRARHWSVSIAECPSESFYCSFILVVVDFTLGSWASYLISGSQSFNESRARVLACEVDLK